MCVHGGVCTRWCVYMVVCVCGAVSMYVERTVCVWCGVCMCVVCVYGMVCGCGRVGCVCLSRARLAAAQHGQLAQWCET